MSGYFYLVKLPVKYFDVRLRLMEDRFLMLHVESVLLRSRRDQESS